MSSAELVTRIASELALFSGVGFLLFALNDLAIDCIYFSRRMWRSATIYRKFPRAFGETFAKGGVKPRFLAVFVPAWDESAVIGSMLKAALARIDYPNYRIFVGHYRNDQLIASAIAEVADPRIEPFAEAGLYRRPMPWRFELDAYAQAGIVSHSERDLSADGAIAFTRPMYGRFSAGFGFWGGYQPGLYRLDAGPRVTIRVRDNIRAHVDWRQRLVGTAQPSSGPALTLAADF